jgi:hypothetical protein
MDSFTLVRLFAQVVQQYDRLSPIDSRVDATLLVSTITTMLMDTCKKLDSQKVLMISDKGDMEIVDSMNAPAPTSLQNKRFMKTNTRSSSKDMIKVLMILLGVSVNNEQQAVLKEYLKLYQFILAFSFENEEWIGNSCSEFYKSIRKQLNQGPSFVTNTAQWKQIRNRIIDSWFPVDDLVLSKQIQQLDTKVADLAIQLPEQFQKEFIIVNEKLQSELDSVNTKYITLSERFGALEQDMEEINNDLLQTAKDVIVFKSCECRCKEEVKEEEVKEVEVKEEKVKAEEAKVEEVKEEVKEEEVKVEVKEEEIKEEEVKEEEVKAEEVKVEEVKEEKVTVEEANVEVREEEAKVEVKEEKDEVKAEEAKVEVKAEEAKVEVKAEEVKAEEAKAEEAKAEEAKVEVKAEEAKVEVKAEETKVEETKEQLKTMSKEDIPSSSLAEILVEEVVIPVVEAVVEKAVKVIVSEVEVVIEKVVETFQEEVEAPMIIEPEASLTSEDHEHDGDIQIVKFGNYYLIRGTRVVIDVATCNALGYLDAKDSFRSECTDEVKQVCEQYGLLFQ